MGDWQLVVMGPVAPQYPVITGGSCPEMTFFWKGHSVYDINISAS